MPLGLQGTHTQVIDPGTLPHPGEVVPDQQIDQKLIVEITHGIGVFQRVPGQLSQFVEMPETFDQPVFVCTQTCLQDIASSLHIHRQAGAGQGGQQRVPDQLATLEPGIELLYIIVDLFQQHRGEIDHRPGIRVVLQVGGHVRIVLDPMQIDPGQMIVALTRPFVIGLVHMPAEDNLQLRLLTSGHGE